MMHLLDAGSIGCSTMPDAKRVPTPTPDQVRRRDPPTRQASAAANRQKGEAQSLAQEEP